MIRFATWLHAWKDRHDQHAALAQLTDRDISDMGLDRAEAMALIDGPADIPERVADMASVFGLPVDAVQRSRAVALDMFQTCANCPDREGCARGLAGDAAARAAVAADCPNRATFQAMAARGA